LGRWTDEEHELFLEALKIYGKDWEAVEKHIGTRDAAHVRSHA
jgi:MYB-related transcription factor LHY